jgi:hypothetical protein
LDYFAPRSEALPHLRKAIEDVSLAARERGVEPIDESTILDEFQRNPHRVRTFFQCLGGRKSAEMLVMAWRVIQGMEISRASFNYVREREFEFEVVLRSPSGKDETYLSRHIRDAALLRHFGIAEVDQRPYFDGIYPLRAN